MTVGEGIKVLSTTGIVNEIGSGRQTEKNLVLKNGDELRIIPLVPDTRKLYLEVTTACNFDCTTCIRHSWLDGLGQMDWATFERLAEQLDDLHQLETVHFGGFGEPLTHPAILDMLEALSSKGLKLEIITNGSLLTEEVALKLIDLGLEKIYVSLDGADDKEYNRIREGADFNQVYANIRQLHRLKEEKGVKKPSINIEFVAMKSNYHRLPDLVRLMPEIGARELLVTNVLPYHESMVDEVLYDRDEFDIFSGHQILALMRAKLPEMKLRTERYCKFIEDKAVVVDWRGEVNPCYALMHTYYCYIYGRKKKFDRQSFGNVNEKRLADIWTNPDYAYFRNQVKNFRFPSCTDCPAADGCAPDNLTDCWGNFLSCSDCLWSRGIVVCP